MSCTLVLVLNKKHLFDYFIYLNKKRNILTINCRTFYIIIMNLCQIFYILILM